MYTKKHVENFMITNSRISFGDQLGAQMMTLANLIYLSDINNQKIVFWDELKNFRRGYQFLDVFECNNINLIKSEPEYDMYFTFVIFPFSITTEPVKPILCPPFTVINPSQI